VALRCASLSICIHPCWGCTGKRCMLTQSQSEPTGSGGPDVVALTVCPAQRVAVMVYAASAGCLLA
jgi:hypothetical protein